MVKKQKNKASFFIGKVLLILCLLISSAVRSQQSFDLQAATRPLSGIGVNHVTGDFSYALPLIDLPALGGNFPINLTYNAGIGAEQEASWIGLGWNCSPGAIYRNRKGFPDDWNAKILNNYYYKFPESYFKKIDAENSYVKVDWLNEKQTVFGSLNFSKACKTDQNYFQNPSFIMDVHQNAYNESFSDETSLAQVPALSFPSYDDYQLIAPGIQCKISPKIFEFGTLSANARIFKHWEEIKGNNNHLPSHELMYLNKNKFSDTKIHFYVQGEHASYARISPRAYSPIDYDTSRHVFWGNNMTVNKINPFGDLVFNNQNNKYKTGNVVVWYSNKEIAEALQEIQTSAITSGFLECSEMKNLRLNEASTDPQAIGAFSLTTPDGKTFHYSLPVYQLEEFTCLKKIDDPENDINVHTNFNKYAYCWLLTAITGPDFVDRGIIGMVDDQDWGYWVKFEYGKWSEAYPWRNPYSGSIQIPAGNWYSSKDEYASHSFGLREIYYLNAVKTQTHTAFFVKSLRNDALSLNRLDLKLNIVMSDNESITLQDTLRHQLLKLDKIIVLKNADAYLIQLDNKKSNLITQGLGNVQKGNEIWRTFKIHLQENILDMSDLSANWSEIQSKAEQVVVLDQDYELCKNNPGSRYGGKLTLKKLDFFHVNSIKKQPSFEFKYHKNPDYRAEYKDKWGFYSVNSDDTQKNDADAWSLNEIKLPYGGKIKLEYQSDHYQNVQYPTGGIQWGNFGGGLRISKITMDEGKRKTYTKYNYLNPGSSISSGTLSYRPNLPGYVKNLYELPEPAVLYEFVCQEEFGDDDSLIKKVQYQFDVSEKIWQHDLQHSLNEGIHTEKDLNGNIINTYDIRLRTAILSDHATALGRILSTTTYNKLNHIIEQINYEYFPVSDIKAGIMQESFNQYKRFFNPWSPDHTKSNSLFISCLSSKISYPNVLKRITKTQNGLTTYEEFGDESLPNNGFDILTGKPLVTSVFSSNKLNKTYTVPAYTKDCYQAMGSKVDNPNNKNMLIHPSATYQLVKDHVFFSDLINRNQEPYYLNLEETTENTVQSRMLNNEPVLPEGKLIAASAQTYKNKWFFRDFVKGENLYRDNKDSVLNTWKPFESYLWNSLVNLDGTIKTNQGVKQRFVHFNHCNEVNSPNWLKLSQIAKIDPHAQVLEACGENSKFSSSKLYPDKYHLLASCDASYKEFTFSGAEQSSYQDNYLEGEVIGAENRYNATSNPEYAHTGNFSIKLMDKQKAFEYTIQTENNHFPLKYGISYTASVWVRNEMPDKALPEQAAIQVLCYNNGQLVFQNLAQASGYNTQKAGNWYLLKLNFSLPDTLISDKISIVAFTKAKPNLPVYFDDFKFNPTDKKALGYIYDSVTGSQVAVLNEENRGVKYIYDAAGNLIQQQQEFFDENQTGGFIKTKELEYNFSRSSEN